MTKKLIAALVAATALLVPAASQAATVSLESGSIVYRGEGAEGNWLLVSTFQPFGDPNTYLSLDDSAPQTILSGPCFKYGDFDPMLLCPLDRASRCGSRAAPATTTSASPSPTTPHCRRSRSSSTAATATIRSRTSSTASPAAC